MKILFTRFPLESRKNGGAERQVITLMEGLLKKGHAVAFAGSCPALLELCRERNIPSTPFHIGPPPVTKMNAVSFAWRKQGMANKLKILLNGFSGLDALVMLSLTEKLLMTEEAVKKGIRVFWIEHDPVGRWLTKNPWLPQLFAASRHATVVTVSELSRGVYLKLGFDPDKVIAIPNGIDLSRFPSDSSVSSESLRKIGSVSRLDREKGLDLLIQSIRDLPDVSLTILGSGKEEDNLRKQIAALPHPEHVTIIHDVHDLGAFYRSLDLFVLPSRTNDPFGLVAAEAMALGVPVVVTDACGIASYLKDGEDAVIVKADDADALRAGIQSLSDPERRKAIAEKGRDEVQRVFSAEKMVERYGRLFTQ